MLKLSFMTLISMMLMLNNKWILEMTLLLAIIFLMKIGKVPILKIRGMRMVLSASLFLFVIQIVFTQTGKPLFSLLKFQLTDIGLQRGLLISTRFTAIIFTGFLFVFITNPNNLIYSLMQVGISHRIGFSLITALRLITIFQIEIEKIYYSSLFKGVTYEIFPVKTFFRNLTNFFKLIFISIFEKVDALVRALEGRAFNSTNKRTYFREIEFTNKDLSLLILGIGIFIIFIMWIYGVV